MKKIVYLLLISTNMVIFQLDARIANITNQVKQDTKELEKALKNKEKVKTAAEKAAAEKNVYQIAQNLLGDLKEERTWASDIYSGYSQTKIKQARLAMAKLEPMRKKVVDALAIAESDLEKVTDKGWIWNAALPTKEVEYNNLSIEVNKLKNSLKRIDRAIRNQKVVAGDEWSNAFRALVTAGVITTAAIGTDLVLTGGATTTTLAGKSAAMVSASGSWLKGKATTLWNKLPNIRSNMPAIKITDESATIDGTTFDKPSLIARFGQGVAESTLGTLAMAKDIAVQTTISAGVSTALAIAMKQFKSLLEDPETTPDQIEAQNRKMQTMIEQAKSTQAAQKKQPQK